ncbi:MAG TPA: Lrp/AsnC family transcriptional regulator [Thermoproteales archaeon]|nr:Lrp/AsnC family transcriptional regulator [Thermoproteales archaeon]
MDEIDCRILEELQVNCRIKVKELARKIGKPITTIYARIRRLEEQGYIKAYKAMLNPQKFGLETLAFVFVSFTYGTERRMDQREVLRKIASFPEVQEAHIITGDWDILLKVRVKNVEELGKFIVDKLRTVEGVEKTLTSVVLDTAKESYEIPLRCSER